MSEFISLPYRSSPTTSIGPVVKRYLANTSHFEMDPRSFNVDIAQWERLRKSSFSGTDHKTAASELLEYNALLLSVLDKFPPDIGLSLTYHPIFRAANTQSITSCNLHLERVLVVFNLASLYSRQAKAAAGTDDGVVLAKRYSQLAAGTLSYLIESVLPLFHRSNKGRLPTDLRAPFFVALRWLMLAQAQEWLYYVEDIRAGSKSSDGFFEAAPMLARPYKMAYLAILDSKPSVSSAFPSHWATLFQLKSLYFDSWALALSPPKDVGGWSFLVALVNQALDLCECTPRTPSGLVHLLEELDAHVSKKIRRMPIEHDYTCLTGELPSSKVVPETDCVQDLQPDELSDANFLAFGSIFRTLAPLSMDLDDGYYYHAIHAFLETRIVHAQRKLDAQQIAKLEEWDLPDRLNLLDASFGFPGSLADQIAEITKGGGVKPVYCEMEVVSNKSRLAIQTLKESLSLLHQEVHPDYHRESSDSTSLPALWGMEPPTNLAEQVVALAESVKSVGKEHIQAADELKAMMTQIETFSQPIDQLSTTLLPPGPLGDPRSSTSAASPLSKFLRRMHELLKHLETLKSGRASVVASALALAEQDRLPIETSSKSTSIRTPAQLKRVVNDGLKKYEMFTGAIAEEKGLQDKVLAEIRVVLESISKLAPNDRACQDRRKALDALTAASIAWPKLASSLSMRNKYLSTAERRTSTLFNQCKAWAAEYDKKTRLIEDLCRAMTSWKVDALGVVQSQVSRSRLRQLPSV